MKLEELEKNHIIDLIKLAQLVNNCWATEVKQKAIRDGLSLEKFMDTARATEIMDVQFGVEHISLSECS